MSKDIAQTVGGRRFAWLLALLAVFALFAGSQFATSASAAGTGDGTLSAPEDVQGELTLQVPDDPSTTRPNVLIPGLYHVGPTGELMVVYVSSDATFDYFRAQPRDVENNVIGFDHTVCLVTDDDNYTFPGGIVVENVNIENDLLPTGQGGINPVVTANGFYNWRIQPLIGAADVVAAVKITMDFSGDFDNGSGLNDVGLPCVQWWSSQPGEQNVTVTDGAGNLAADWSDNTSTSTPTSTPANLPDVCDDTDVDPVDNLCDNNIFTGNNSQPLVKEWNVLDRTTITRTAIDTTVDGATVHPASPPANLDGTTVTVPALFNPANSTYQAAAQVFYENVYGIHTTSGGATINPIVAGARVTFTASGSCGLTTVDPLGTTTLEGGPFVIGPTQSVTVTSIGVSIRFDVATNGCTVLSNMTHTVTITVAYPTNIGSQNPPVPPAETITVRWTGTIAEKKVLLAWAGQRILLEYDWRLPPGGIDVGPGDGTPDDDAERCVFAGSGIAGGSFVSLWLKQFGPGTFLGNNELGPFMGIADLFLHLVQPDQLRNLTDVDSCVSRGVYESNEPGQVDITLQVTDVCPFGIQEFPGANQRAQFPGCDPLNQTKVDFVIYIMKFEDVRLSLVTSVSKPTHNSSSASWNDYSPGNPWNASSDVTTTEWNVSKDLLVRGRVRGWFVNSNPSGRARDDSDPLNVRPADRWVLPDDWAILAGGPADPADGSDARGTAEEFRPYYDLMIAPNNTSNLSLATPYGGTLAQVATVVAHPAGANNATTFAVSSVANISVGSTISVPAVGTSGGPGVCTTPGASTVTAITPVLNGVGNVIGVTITVSPALCATPAAGAAVFLAVVPFEGPLSLIDLPGFNSGAAPSNRTPGSIRDTTFKDGDVDMWDAPMPQAPVSVKIRGAGFIKEVLKQDVYYNGTANGAKVYPNPYYIVNVPGEPWISAISAGGGFLWDSWALDGPGGAGQGNYEFWQFARRDVNIVGVGDALSNTDRAELQAIRDYYKDQSITRDAVVFSDNHGEFMVTANGDFKLDYSGCATNAIAGGKHCKPGDKVGSSSITATVDYPEFRGKHPPVASNTVTVDWTWAGYKDVTIEDGETPQFKYIVFHAMDRDGFCSVPYSSTGQVSLHPVLSSLDEGATIGLNDPVETVDFLIDAGEGIIVDQASGGSLNRDGNRQFATGVRTFSTAANTTLKEFPFSPLAAAEQTDECQAWVKVSNSLLGIVNFLVVAHNDEGDIGFDRVVDLQTTATYTLNFRWSLITWNGADNIPVADALGGTGANDAGNDISAEVTAVYGWDQAAQDWLGYFPAGVSVPGANDLTHLRQGSAYWIAIKAPGPVTWTYATNVD